MPQFALQMRQISKTYGSVRANDSINFSVKTGTIHGLAGENGAGKSTLMKILFGLTEADPSNDSTAGLYIDEKKVQFRSPLDAIDAGVGMVQQHFALAGALTALDNIILGAEPVKSGLVDRRAAQKTLETLAGKHLQVPWNEEVELLTVGLQQRIEILKLLFRKARILILDEPTAVLTPQETEIFFALLRDLRAEGRTIILISHKLQEVLSLCDEVTVLRQGRVTGHFSTQGLSREELVRSMIGRDIQPLARVAVAPGEVLVKIENLVTGDVTGKPGNSSGRGCLRGVTFQVHKNEIVGVAGVEGNGQSALVEALLSLNQYTGGIQYKSHPLSLSTRAIREKFNFGLISEDRHEQSLWLDASVAENMAIGFLKTFSRFGLVNKKAVIESAAKKLAPYKVAMHSVNQTVRSLSGGNQQKIVIAREISMRNPEFLIASQPTRGVDVGAIEFIHQQIVDLKNHGAGILLISSELEELCALSDRIVVLFEGRIVAEFKNSDFDLKRIGLAMTGGGA